MRPEPPVPGSPADWLRHARSDLLVARQQVSKGVLYETICFHAQQAAEKSLKAILLHYGIRFPHTHDIAMLITLVKAGGVDFPEELGDAAALTDYAVGTRYPGPWDEVSGEDHRLAVSLAQRVFKWAQAIIT